MLSVLALALLAAPPPPAYFARDVSAVLSRGGCNAGACHGNLTGQGGFKLSLRGEDPAFDFADGSTRDVTPCVAFDTSALGVATVKPTGEIVRDGFGEVVVLVRYLGHQVPVRLAFVPDRAPPDLSSLKSDHAIDSFVAKQLQ